MIISFSISYNHQSFTLKNVPDARRSKASSEAYFCSMLSAEAEATTLQMGVFQRQLNKATRYERKKWL